MYNIDQDDNGKWVAQNTQTLVFAIGHTPMEALALLLLSESEG